MARLLDWGRGSLGTRGIVAVRRPVLFHYKHFLRGNESPLKPPNEEDSHVDTVTYEGGTRSGEPPKTPPGVPPH